MGVGTGLYMYVVVVQKFTFAMSSPDEFLYKRSPKTVDVTKSKLRKANVYAYTETQCTEVVTITLTITVEVVICASGHVDSFA